MHPVSTHIYCAMLIVVSPSKILDQKPQKLVNEYTMPAFLDKSEILIEALRKFSPKQISELLSVNSAIAELNFGRYAAWHRPFTPENAKQAILLFKGEVYNGLRAWTLNHRDFMYAQDHLHILSGLYGVIRPLDLIQPYRLEMGIKLKTSVAENIYRFWGDDITNRLNETLKPMKKPLLVNLASHEYFKAVNLKLLTAPVLNIEFLDTKNGNYQAIVVYLKKARGMMSRFILQNQLTNPDDLKAFDSEGYIYNPRLSKENTWIFTKG
jgi:uncharacterized protein